MTSHRDPRPFLEQAILAPSSHNTQPWVFDLADNAVDLYADRSRSLPVNDPDGRELTISCAAALLNLRVAAAARGVRHRVDILPHGAASDLLARVSFGDGDTRTGPGVSSDAALGAAIGERRTYRQDFAGDRPVDVGVVERLQQAAAHEGAQLTVLESADRHVLAELVAEGDRLLFADPRWRRELADWMRAHRRGDGLPVPALALPITRFVVSRFDVGGRTAAKDADLAARAPVLAVLSTVGDGPGDWLAAGQGLQRTLLTATAQGLQASFLNQPIQVAALRGRLTEMVGGLTPQIGLRIGYPQKVLRAAPRRPLDDVIRTAHADSSSPTADMSSRRRTRA